ncbi:type VI secretion system membrane subunit TssM [Parendozoicomonas sp. Alg238-R29]|uniref:type VI secretion system membrane subunit TssM n=1 Tax=Parendozoicomonas sp. Alg238-R29 TaxID=2993446 RepID=UPI00248F1469|nr:type VI secretion system membrane subunit TssM [Parendozoicomonas sp. Alg238-R29]
MSSLKKNLTIILIILLCFSLFLIWAGYYIWPEALSGLEQLSTRVELSLLIIGVPALLWALLYGISKWRQHQHRLQQNQELQYLRREKQRLNQNWKKLLKQLKTQPGGYNSYSLPWLAMLGDDTSGKSSWLQQAGFERVTSLTESDNERETDDIVFWISEHAVVLELAGHYLEENTSELDTPILQHLFSLLKGYRPRQPLTGVLVARSANQLIVHQPSWLQEQARHLRRRLRELDTMTGIKLPVWLQVTQCDQLEGFQACFNQSCSTERSMPLGINLPDGYQPDVWQQAFKELQQSLTTRLTELLHSEKDVTERQAITRFLLQLTLLQERIKISFDELYGNRHHAPVAWIAGVWLSSAAQAGNSYNLLASEISRSWGFQNQRQQPQRLGNNSYFIRSFFPRVALPTLAGVEENNLARHFWQGKVLGAAALTTLLLAGSALILWENVVYNQNLQALTTEELNNYTTEINALGTNADIADLIPPLLRLRELVQTFEQPRSPMLDIGLFDHQAAEKVRYVYINQMQQRLFLPLAERSQDTLSAFVHLGNNEEVFHNLLHYLMLFDADIRQNQELNNYLADMLADREELPEGTEGYLFALLDDLWSTQLDNFTPDSNLIAQARSDLSQRIDNQLVYDFIRAQPEHAGKIDIRNRLGENFTSHFRFNDGFDRYYLPVIFTREGYGRLDLTSDSELIKKAVANLARVKGDNQPLSLAERNRISGKVRELYFLDYIRIWKTLISNISLVPGHGVDQQLELLESLYQGDTPALFDLIAAIADQTQLEPETEEEPSDPTKKLLAKQAEKKAAKALGLKGASKKIAKSASRSALAKLQKQRTAAIVDETFRTYATFYADRGDAYTAQLDLLYSELQAISAHPDSNQAYFDSAVKLAKGEGSSLPELQRLAKQERTAAGVWLKQLTHALWQEWLAGAGNHIQENWHSGPWNTWQNRFYNRFPFAKDARRETRLGDFVEFLRPDGELDQFINHYLAPFVVYSQERGNRHWQLRTVNGATLALNQGFLKQLAQADRISDAYFSANGDLDISYRMRARRLSSDITTFNLRDGNGNFSYSHGPLRWQERHWPQDSAEILSLNFSNSGLQLARNSYSGPWAWQRFMADSSLWEGNGQMQLTYGLKKFDITLELELDRRSNPFDPALLSSLSLSSRIITIPAINKVSKDSFAYAR